MIDAEENKKESVAVAELLLKHVSFYQALPPAEKDIFLNRVLHFLETVAITPIQEAPVTELDKVYVAASAIIPIFAFKGWAYNNLDEVLIYPGTFGQDFNTSHPDNNVLGMVGSGAMNRMMILSLVALRQGFEQKSGGNTAVHEFVHLLDKADGATDGVPEYMIPKELIVPWVQKMHQIIKEIRDDDSEINPYAGTNEAEFFAVVSEYFFKHPEFLEEQHPKLYSMLETIYQQDPEATASKTL